MQIKIAHIVTALSWRGGEQQVAYLIEELMESVNQVVICSQHSKMAKHCESRGIPFFALKKKNSLDLGFAKKIKEICLKENIDICHLHDAHAHTFAVLSASIFNNKTPFVLSRRVDFPIKNTWTSKYKYNHSSIKKIICVSNAIKEITSKGIQDQSKLLTVYSGIDLSKFSPRSGELRKELGYGNEVFLVGNTSALADHKDYFTFIDAANIAVGQDDTIQFVVFGNGPMANEIKEYACKSNIGDNIRFLGFREDVPQLLADLDAFMMSSKTEGLGTSILDAFACQVPVVSTNAGGIPELVLDGETGLLSAVKNAEELAKNLLRLKSDPDLRKAIVAKALARVKAFSKKNTAMQTLKIYEGLFLEPRQSK